MSLSRIKYPSTGVASLFSIPFEFLAKAHIEVYLDGVQTSAYSWVGDKAIMLTTVPTSGTIVEIRRNTPKDKRLVNFQDGSMLGEADLDTDSNQIFFMAQEGLDDSSDTISALPTGAFDAKSRRVSNVADPTDPYDAVNKRTLSYEYPDVVTVGQHLAEIQAVAVDLTIPGVSVQDLGSITSPLSGTPTGSGAVSTVATNIADVKAVSSGMSAINSAATNLSAITSAPTAASNAASSATASATSATNAASSATASATSATNALASKNAAATSETNALSSKNAAATSATNAASSATAAATSETNALASKNAAATSATNAAASAAQAALYAGGGVTTFNTRSGAVVLSSGDVTAALGFTPLSSAAGSVAATNLASSLDLGSIP